MDQNEADYLRRREAQHRARAEASTDPCAKGLHARFAEGYAERVRLIGVPMADTL